MPRKGIKRPTSTPDPRKPEPVGDTLGTSLIRRGHPTLFCNVQIPDSELSNPLNELQAQAEIRFPGWQKSQKRPSDEPTPNSKRPRMEDPFKLARRQGFQAFQCLHHINNLIQPDLPKAFLKKMDQMENFIQPALPTDSLRAQLASIRQEFGTNSAQQLVHHYFGSLFQITEDLIRMEIPQETLSQALETAFGQSVTRHKKKLLKTTKKNMTDWSLYVLAKKQLFDACDPQTARTLISEMQADRQIFPLIPHPGDRPYTPTNTPRPPQACSQGPMQDLTMDFEPSHDVAIQRVQPAPSHPMEDPMDLDLPPPPPPSPRPGTSSDWVKVGPPHPRDNILNSSSSSSELDIEFPPLPTPLRTHNRVNDGPSHSGDASLNSTSSSSELDLSSLRNRSPYVIPQRRDRTPIKRSITRVRPSSTPEKRPITRVLPSVLNRLRNKTPQDTRGPKGTPGRKDEVPRTPTPTPQRPPVVQQGRPGTIPQVGTPHVNSGHLGTPLQRLTGSSPTSPSPRHTRSGRPLGRSFPAKVTYHKAPNPELKKNWEIQPTLSSKVLILGTSNLARITTKPSQEMDIHSFPGGRFQHMEHMLEKAPVMDGPQKVIIAMGINDSNNKTPINKIRKSIQNTAVLAQTKFPGATIHMAAINLSADSPDLLTRRTADLNATIHSLPDVQVIPRMRPDKVILDPKDRCVPKVHWTQGTANEILMHWSAHLN